ncbi:LysR family transcriptional regulator [Muricoccus radiodurans]|uniref:LysR family transcriptional regulator n=1 Tax=Muricoccus radiodurans TaxID=2231721 RepID=UPI003CF04687
MDIEDLRTFVEVADAGGISTAARRLGASKSVVSRSLARLEAELGIQLLARTTRGAALTEAGSTFRDHAARACAEIDLARETILPAGQLCGRLRVAVPLTFGPIHLAPVLANMARQHPQLHIYASYTDRFVDLIAEGFDCAIRIGYLPDSNLIARRVGPIHGKLVASPEYIQAHGLPETPDELLTHQALMQGTETWQLMDGNRIITVRPQGRFKADNGTALAAAALAGLGIAWIPDGITQEHLASGALLPVMTRYPPPPAGVYVIRPPGHLPARKIRVLIELLIECFGQVSAPDTVGSGTREGLPRRGEEDERGQGLTDWVHPKSVEVGSA